MRFFCFYLFLFAVLVFWMRVSLHCFNSFAIQIVAVVFVVFGCNLFMRSFFYYYYFQHKIHQHINDCIWFLMNMCDTFAFFFSFNVCFVLYIWANSSSWLLSIKGKKFHISTQFQLIFCLLSFFRFYFTIFRFYFNAKLKSEVLLYEKKVWYWCIFIYGDVCWYA